MTPLVDTVLLLALVVTSACVVPMYLKLKRLDRTQAEYGRIFAESGHALASAGAAVRSFSTEGRAILEDLTVKIDEARKTLSDLEASRRSLAGEIATAHQPHVDRPTTSSG
ncbi:MAG: hypothetical protein K2Y56_10365 [Methylobacterium sp.]|uniref:hypothetical protein n=1 Tax=Methylobacterium sp. TaxID=409 RepID=UPI0025E9C399|nr:hypothetical protein [Methylobacterium sp.]MBX9931924.1 hypothetical protein [Methylobacterium sp.]